MLNRRALRARRDVTYMNKCVRGNTNLCMGCRTCLIACVEAHSDKPVFEIRPEDINFNPKLHMIKTFDITVPYQCRHCENPECMKVCKKGAIYRGEDKILIDVSKCDGCADCVDACPFGAIDMKPAATLVDGKLPECPVANKCDLCEGVEGGPACVRVCPTNALKVVETSEIVENAADRRARELKRNQMAHNLYAEDK